MTFVDPATRPQLGVPDDPTADAALAAATAPDLAGEYEVPPWMNGDLVTRTPDGRPVVVVRFPDDSTTVMTPVEVCDHAHMCLGEFHQAMAALIGGGWLTLLPDGTYAATIPPDTSDRDEW